MVNGEICIGLFALRNIKKVCLHLALIIFMLSFLVGVHVNILFVSFGKDELA
jgi:multisubunit Na+/H+ antiporter MnhF subunit